jgi:hypothetical protein
LKKIIIIVLAFTQLVSCSKKHYGYKRSAHKPIMGAIDFANLDLWAAHPNKFDMSDNIPKSIKGTYKKLNNVDVFFLYPTSLTDNADSRMFAPIDDSAINEKTDKNAILYQASVFNECNVYAPRYRQAHLKCFYQPQAQVKQYFDTAYADVKAAFEYYLQNINKGNPIIIASHSQGTVHAGRLVKEFFEGKDLLKQLVCAYLIGMPIKQSYFSNINPCNNANATGCFVSWRTYEKGYVDPNTIAKETERVFVVNPLSWTMDTTLVPASQNIGGTLFNFDKVITKLTDAQINKNILWSSKPNVLGASLIKQKNFHAGDINLFYMNIRMNVRDRVAAFLYNK